MGVDRVQERSSADAIGLAAFEPRGIYGTGVAAYYIISGAAGVIWIVDAELRVIKNVKSLGTEFQLSGLANLEMLEQSHIEVGASRIVEEVASGVAESEAARSDKLGRITDNRAKA